MIIYIKHIDIEGPGTLGDYLDSKGFDSQAIEMEQNDSFPADLTDIDAVVSLGGPMNVYEEDKYPFLKEENEFIKRLVSEEVPFLGLCLGSQLLAKATEAKVVRSPNEEVGFSTISFTSEGCDDELFKGLDKTIGVYQWHGDMFTIPDGGVLLAESEGCPHQAFKVGTCAYGLQFHVEITDKSIEEWSDKYFEQGKTEFLEKKERMLSDYVAQKEIFDNTATKIYDNFYQIIKNANRVSSN